MAGVAAMLGQSAVWTAWLLPLSGVVFTVDAAGGVFMAVTGGVAVAAGLYGIGYCRHGLDGRGAGRVPAVRAALLLVPVAGSVGRSCCAGN